ncbi:MAG: hypothetical protein PHO41_06565 [Eubacteriales bacterium]|nr:hypothetical protein [Eubacteriales bacterium]
MTNATLLLTALFFTWVVFTLSMAWGSTSFAAAKGMTKALYNARITLNNAWPLKYYQQVCRKKQYLFLFCWALGKGAVAAALFYWLGSIKIGLVLLILLPLAQGLLAGAGEPKTRLYAAFTALFSLTALVLSCCMGAMNNPALIWLAVLLLAANAGFITLGMHIGAEGVPGLAVIEAKAYRM